MSDSQKGDAAVRDRRGRFAAGHPHRWAPGQSGNPGGRPKGASFATALAKQAATPVADREEMTKIAESIGLDPEQAQNIDVVAALFYAAMFLLTRARRNRQRPLHPQQPPILTVVNRIVAF